MRMTTAVGQKGKNMRLIDAEELLRRGLDYFVEEYQGTEEEFERTELKELVDDSQTVDAVPVRHGKWIQRTEYIDDMGFTGCRCSECNYWKPMGVWHYCPNCGSRMDEE